MDITNSQGLAFDMPKGNASIIKVIGVGGGGNNALKHMYERGIHGVDFVICNTDAQTLQNNPISNKVQLGIAITEGLGAGADPEVGEKAAIESIEDIKAALGQNTKMVFVTAGMGGGTGTGAAPVIAKIAKEMGILTIGIVTVPFSFEGKRRIDQADLGLEKLRNNVDSLIVINNDKLRQQFGNLGFRQGFSKADEVLTNAAKGMAEVITGYFDVNIDFRDAKSVLQNSGTALMSTGIASGENKAEEAVKKALDSPLLNDNKITGAKNVLLLIRSGAEEATMDEIGVIMDYIQNEAGNTADIIFGVGTDEELGDSISVLVIATGFSNEDKKFAGPVDKIKIGLNDRIETPKSSPFKSREEIESASPSNFNDKKIIRLDDEDASTPTFFANTDSAILEKVEEKKELKIEEFGFAEDYNLFSFESSEEKSSNGFSYNEKQDINQLNFLEEEEKPIEIKLTINEPEIHSPKEVEVVNSSVEETIETTADADLPLIEEVQPTEEIIQQEQGFTILNKKQENSIVEERRNKLKEFSSRYQSTDVENSFETIPAYKRKNVLIEKNNPSEAINSRFLFEGDKGVEIKENKFYNKDVD